MIPLLLFFVSIILILLLYLFHEGRKNYGVLENCGFPVIKPTLFLGSIPTLHKQVHFLEDIKRAKKYGNIWGLYQGQTPHVYIADPELFRLIYVKNFEHFYDRREIDLGHGLLEESIDFLAGEKWKKVRNLLSPFFTTSKIKNMVDVIELHAKEYTSKLEKECRESGNGTVKFDCGKRISAYLIDMFTRTVLGIKLEHSENPDNEFAKAFRSILGGEMEYGWMYSLSMSFPILSKLSPHFDPKNEEVIQQVIDDVILKRTPGSISDSCGYVHLWHDMLDQLGSPEFEKLGITQKTIISQIVVFYLGGFDTSTTTISHLLYFLAKSPAKQEKLYLEIMSKFPKKGLIMYQELREENVPFLMSCIKEALRLAPPVFRPERICIKDWTHDGIKIKKGTEVYLPSWAVHRNPKYWTKPEEFYPERFLPEEIQNEGFANNPYAFTSFGHGPRNCVGERFAYESIKLIMIHLIRSFEFRIRADTEIRYKPGNLFMVNFESLYLDCVLRQ